MLRARLGKDGIYIAKQGHGVDGGEASLNFSPSGAMQNIFTAGTVQFQTDPNEYYMGQYVSAVVPFGRVFDVPPLAYCQAATSNPDGRREVSLTTFLGLQQQRDLRFPDLWWRTTRTELKIFAYNPLSARPFATYCICQNEAS
ncbi:hypothetical protein [Ochrobactrum sp. SFR4]|uniref:hypothetical protein n=1 Tax=Ochrobactrum sp. SFR4 TaxID=2717368 RepID=UPI001C8C249E|nr:hypothetical protein [Ochrobactrum sp. SFR4]MBX8827261.1 hypothetical protein [Ochrobactrum sp. SFR4]